MLDQRPEVSAWRPQRFGSARARSLRDPLIEPLWTGLRVLAAVSDAGVELRDADGERVERNDVAAGLLAAVQAEEVVLDGYLSPEAARSGVGVYSGPAPETPTPGDVARQLLVGGRNRRKELIDALEARAEAHLLPSDAVAFVAVDLLLLDGQPLLDVPLLERKRLLDAVLVETGVVRVGIHVREPVQPWLATWRNIGFRMLAYKDPNGRYRPGEPNDGWATADIPRG